MLFYDNQHMGIITFFGCGCWEHLSFFWPLSEITYFKKGIAHQPMKPFKHHCQQLPEKMSQSKLLLLFLPSGLFVLGNLTFTTSVLIGDPPSTLELTGNRWMHWWPSSHATDSLGSLNLSRVIIHQYSPEFLSAFVFGLAEL